MSENEQLTGPQRVAAFLLSLDEPVATSVMANLSDDVLEGVARAMLELDSRLSDPNLVERLHQEIADRVSGPKGVSACSSGQLGSLLSGALGDEKGGELVGSILDRRRREHPFRILESHKPCNIARVLKEESRAVAALVFAHLDPEATGEALKSFDEEEALDIVRRMPTVKPPPVPVMLSIAEDFEERLAAIADQPPEPERSERLQGIAEVLARAGGTIEKSVIDAIEADDADMAAELREFMFTWDDIAGIDKRSMQKILGTVDTKTLSIALKGCSKDVEENVMSNLSSRVRDMVAEERELAGAMPLNEVKASRDEILRNIRAMIDSGEFRPTRAGEDLVV